MLQLIRRFSTEGPAGGLRVGFIGLGQMGSRMAPHLVQRVASLTIFDTNPAACEHVRNANPSVVKIGSVKQIAAESDIIVTMLPSGSHVQAVYQEMLKILPKGGDRLLIDCSTIDVSTTKALAQAIAATENLMVDAPVSGGIGGAAGGTLTFMVGGPDAGFDRAKQVLSAMGRNLVHCGIEQGSGQAAKIANNLVLGISMAAVSEGMALGTRLGLNPKTLAGIFNTSSARCWSSDTYNPYPGVMENVPSSRDYEGGFGADLMLKDLGLATDAARKAGVPLPLGASAQQLYQLISAHGLGRKDFSVVFKFLNSNSSSSPASK